LSTRPLILVGGGAGGRIAADVARVCGFTIHGFLDDTKKEGVRVDEIPVVGGFGDIDRFIAAGEFAFGTCFSGDMKKRGDILEHLRSRQVEMPQILHPAASISTYAKLAAGVIVQSHTKIHSGAEIGYGVFIEDQCSIGIDTVVESNVSFGTGVLLNARSRCGSGTFVGSGAIIVPDVVIGSGAFIGAGSVVMKEVFDNQMVLGNPARPIRTL
jgi:sugar O-acyltransferase (sialic acid O-acetyltransferase NeuD family)